MRGRQQRAIAGPRPSVRCTVCAHPQVQTIDMAVAKGANAVAVSKAYGIGRMSVARHRDNCLTAKLARAGGAEREERKNATAVLHVVEDAQRAEKINQQTILDELEALKERTSVQLDRAEREGNIADVARLIREQRENMVVLGKLIGAFPREAASTTTIDARTQTIVAMNEMSADELRALIRVLPGGNA